MRFSYAEYLFNKDEAEDEIYLIDYFKIN